MTHQQHSNRHNTLSRNSGSWAYVGQAKPPKVDLEFHLKSLEIKRDGLLDRVKEAEEINKNSELKDAAIVS